MDQGRLEQWERWLRAGAPALAEELSSTVEQLGIEGAAAVLGVPVWWLRLWTPQGGAGEDA